MGLSHPYGYVNCYYQQKTKVMKFHRSKIRQIFRLSLFLSDSESHNDNTKQLEKVVFIYSIPHESQHINRIKRFVF